MVTQKTIPGIATIIGLVLAGPAAAQTSRVEVSGMYQATRIPDRTFPVGWSADAAVRVGDVWRIVGEVGRTYKTVNEGNLGVDVKLSIQTLAGGPRWSPRARARVTPFLQLLAGAARLGASAQILGRDVGDSSTQFMLQPGGGVSVKLNNPIDVVGQVDYRRMFLDDEQDGSSGENQVRVLAGVRVRF